MCQIAQRNGIEVDVELALGFASHYCKITTMECLVNDGNAVSFLGPLMRAADRGSMQVVKWFVERGCRDMELCLALTAAASSSRIEVAEYLLKHIPLHVLRALSLDILKAAGERSSGCLKGISFLLESNFLCSPEATYSVADSMSKLDEESISSELKCFFKVLSPNARATASCPSTLGTSPRPRKKNSTNSPWDSNKEPKKISWELYNKQQKNNQQKATKNNKKTTKSNKKVTKNFKWYYKV